MEPTPLRQPRTFWQWLTGQEGTLFVPKRQPVTDALEAIESELERIHDKMENFTGVRIQSPAYLKLVDSLDKLNAELIRRSQEESNEAFLTRQS